MVRKRSKSASKSEPSPGVSAQILSHPAWIAPLSIKSALGQHIRLN